MPASDWTDEHLLSMRQEADPLADETVQLLYVRGATDEVNALWDVLLKNSDIPPAGLQPEVYDYLAGSAELPSWAEPALIREGEAFFMRHGLYVLGSLLCASLPECYLMRRGVLVLAETQGLTAHTHRRLYETAQMVVNVMRPGGLEPHGDRGQGIRAAQKVRLMHAAMRHLILRPPPPRQELEALPLGLARSLLGMRWDSQRLGLPINQMDMAYTLLTFSYVIARAVADLGAEVTDNERDACIHAWNVVGHILGVREELMAKDYESASRCFEQIKLLEAGSSEAGAALTVALQGWLTDTARASYPGPILWHVVVKRLPYVITRQLIGDQAADDLGLRRPHFLERSAMTTLRLAERILARWWQQLTGRFGAAVGQKLVEQLTKLEPQWNRDLFDLPDSLRYAWSRKKERTAEPPG
jgi:hypothetical protein